MTFIGAGLPQIAELAGEISEGTSISEEAVFSAKDAYLAKLDTSFSRVRLDRATPLQTAYMRAIDMGLLFTPEHGYAAFTVPDFDQYMLRAVPDLVVPEVRRRKNRDG